MDKPQTQVGAYLNKYEVLCFNFLLKQYSEKLNKPISRSHLVKLLITEKYDGL